MTTDYDDSHKCPKNGCQQRVPYEQLACSVHWYQVPRAMRNAVWRAYRDHGMGSAQHRAAIRAAVGALNGEH